jgi:hypothetical protein
VKELKIVSEKKYSRLSVHARDVTGVSRRLLRPLWGGKLHLLIHQGKAVKTDFENPKPPENRIVFL